MHCMLGGCFHIQVGCEEGGEREDVERVLPFFAIPTREVYYPVGEWTNLFRQTSYEGTEPSLNRFI